MKKAVSLFTVLSLAVVLFSCAGTTKEERGTNIGAGIGAGVGAILGQAIGRNTGSTVMGAAIGAMVGGIAGNQVGAYMDRQERELRDAIAASQAENMQRTNEAIAASQAASVQRTQDVLTATFRSEVFFDFDSATIKPGGYAELHRVADVLNRYPDTTILVEGYTDNKGSEAYNQRLSEQRAQTVKEALVQMGVAANRIQAVGYGKSRPISSNDAMNRRVNIVITPVVQAKG
jgi:outer membrane protein OmpA-like peptidoglycan-associated protein